MNYLVPKDVAEIINKLWESKVEGTTVVQTIAGHILIEVQQGDWFDALVTFNGILVMFKKISRGIH